MHTDELWQVFHENGEPIVGKGALDDAFVNNSSMVMGNAHVWFWKKDDTGVSILLQKRSMSKKESPGYYHISAGGHINIGESALDAAVRETREEMGVDINPELLYLIHVTRTKRNIRDLKHVYVYKLTGGEVFSFDDGEVAAVEWRSMGEFQKMTQDAEAFMLIDQGKEYFDPLLEAIERQAI
jgi:isopentenyl-diphosphate delta-isomerase